MCKIRLDPAGFQVMDQVRISNIASGQNLQLALRCLKRISVKGKFLRLMIPVDSFSRNSWSEHWCNFAPRSIKSSTLSRAVIIPDVKLRVDLEGRTALIPEW